MTGTLDIKSSFQAIPEMARYPAAEQGGALYKQIKELASAREENIEKARMVPETRGKESQSHFHVIQFPGDESRGSRNHGGQGRKFSRNEEPYFPSREKNRNHPFARALREEALGERVDTVA